MNQLILGSLEDIAIPSLGIKSLLAKVDTGAFSGSLHCTDIHVERHDKAATLYFTPLGDKALSTSVDEFKEIIVRSANGQEDIRYIIPVSIIVQGEKYKTVLGISDRTSMRRDMLLGRRFLLDNNVLVDVTLSKDIDDEAEKAEEES